MKNKISKYIGLFVGILLTFTILYANDNYKSVVPKGSYYDFITYDINRTRVYDMFCLESRRSLSCVTGYTFWYILFVIGFWLSWKYRIKLGSMIINIHQKIINK